MKQMRMVQRRQERGPMETVGWVATGLAAGVVVAAAALVVTSLPELRRYLKIESM